MLRTRLDALVKECQDHLKWTRLSRDRLTREAARLFVQQFGLFTRHSRRCWAYVVANCPIIEVRKFIVRENLYEEEAVGESHYDLMVQMGKALGLRGEAIDHAAPLPTTTVALLAWEALTKDRPWIEGLAAKAVLERSNAPECGNLSALEAERWMRQLQLRDQDVKFWSLHATVDLIHGSGAYDLLEKHVTGADQGEALVRAARESLDAWKIFLDGIADAASWG